MLHVRSSSLVSIVGLALAAVLVSYNYAQAVPCDEDIDNPVCGSSSTCSTISSHTECNLSKQALNNYEEIACVNGNVGIDCETLNDPEKPCMDYYQCVYDEDESVCFKGNTLKTDMGRDDGGIACSECDS